MVRDLPFVSDLYQHLAQRTVGLMDIHRGHLHRTSATCRSLISQKYTPAEQLPLDRKTQRVLCIYIVECRGFYVGNCYYDPVMHPP